MANYPLPKFHFQVEWGGSTVGFSEVSGLDMQTKPIEYREGSNPVFSKTKMPGMKEYANITMKRGTFGGNIEFYNWFATINLNQVERRNLTISLLDESHSPVMSWSVQNAFPVKQRARTALHIPVLVRRPRAQGIGLFDLFADLRQPIGVLEDIVTVDPHPEIERWIEMGERLIARFREMLGQHAAVLLALVPVTDLDREDLSAVLLRNLCRAVSAELVDTHDDLTDV